MLMSKSNEERFMMGISMCRSARAIVTSSFPKNLSSVEFRKMLFLRYYRNDFDATTRERILAAIENDAEKKS